MKTKKVMSVGLACLLICGAFAGCKKEEKIDTEEHLEILMPLSGYGTDSIQNVANRFMELNPGKTVEITIGAEGSVWGAIDYGPTLNTVDLYIDGGNFFSLVQKGEFTIDGVKYPNRFESMDDIYENPAYGETTLIKDKMYDSFADFYYEKQETSYFMPWASDWQGLVYNSKMFETYGWEVPLTTDHLIEVADQILASTLKSTNKNSLGKDIKVSPFTYSRGDSYWPNVYYQWWAQYDGIEAVELYHEGKDVNGNYTPDCQASMGILKTMEMMETILGTYYKDGTQTKPREKVYTDNTLTFRTYTDIQSTFLYAEEARINATGATTGAMMPNGGWLENEMAENFSEEIDSGKIAFKAMRTPIISAITDKTSFKGDDKLRELIKWIDGGKVGEKPAFATDDDVKIIEDARGIMKPNDACVMIIPVYAKAKDLAKEFIRFLYSDEGAKIFTETTKGVNLPLDLDYNSFKISEFSKSKFEIINSSTVQMMHYHDSIMANSGGRPNPFLGRNVRLEGLFSVSNPADFMSAQEIFVDNYRTQTENWNTYMKNAGLLN